MTGDLSLVSGGDCFSHWHSEDRRPTQDFLHGLHAVAATALVTGNTTLTGKEDIVRVDTTASDVTITLPPAVNGTEITVIKTSANHTLTIAAYGSETINGDNTHTYTTIWSSRTFKAVDGQWSIVWGFIRDKFPHGVFWDSTNQYDGSTTIPYAMRFNTTDYSRLVSVQPRRIAADSTDTKFAVSFSVGNNAANGLQIMIQDQATSTVSAKIFAVGDLQLEEGSTATPFEHRPYGTELALCQRYYTEVAVVPTSSSIYAHTALPVTMRVPPTSITLKAGNLAGATYGTAAYGSSSIRQNSASSGASDALLAVSAER